MAKHRNGKGTNKKTRGMPNKMSLRKHRKSGKSGRPRRERMLESRSSNREEEKRKHAKRRRTIWHESVKEVPK